MKKYFFTYKGEDYEADDPLEVADWILSNIDEDEELKDTVLKAIAETMVNEIEEKVNIPGFEEPLKLLKEMNIRNAQNERDYMQDTIPQEYI